MMSRAAKDFCSLFLSLQISDVLFFDLVVIVSRKSILVKMKVPITCSK